MNEQAQIHYERFRHDVLLAQRIEASFPDDRAWACVAMFYAALHLITAYLIMKKSVRLDPTSAVHPSRKKAMDQCPELGESRTKYRELKDLSEAVRYDPGFTYDAQHHLNATKHFAKVIAIVEPKVTKLLQIT